MEKNRSSKIIAIVALVVAVVGLSLGFAAFSNTLVISSSATVTPTDEEFQVVFSSSNTELIAGAVNTSSVTGTATGDEATIANDGDSPTIRGLKANFTEPGQSVTYTFYVHNAGEYEAFLKSITQANVVEGSTKSCTIPEGSSATQTLVSAACADISLTVTIGEGDNAVEFTGSEANLSRSLIKNAFEKVTVTIAYANNNNRADGAFDVAFGDVSLTYSTAA